MANTEKLKKPCQLNPSIGKSFPFKSLTHQHQNFFGKCLFSKCCLKISGFYNQRLKSHENNYLEKRSRVCRFSENSTGGTVVLLINTLSLRRDCSRQLPAKAVHFLPLGHPPVSIQKVPPLETACIYQMRNFFLVISSCKKGKKKRSKNRPALKSILTPRKKKD